MEELFAEALPFVIPALLPAAALLAARSLSTRARTALAALLALAALGFTADVLLFDHDSTRTLQVPNVFGRGHDAQPHVWILDEVTAPAAAWHWVTVAFLLVAAAWVFVGRKRPPAPPRPVATALFVSLLYLAFRLALEKTAAPRGVVWAVGVSPVTLLILPFFGWQSGRRGLPFGRWCSSLLRFLLLQRVAIVAVSYWVTTRELGTHLDVHRITDLHMPALGERTFASGSEAWLWAVFVPQLVPILVVTFVVGVVLGVVPWWLARRRVAGERG